MKGTVTNQFGVRRPNACIQVVDKEGWSAGAGMTDADGNYTIRGLPEGAGITAEFRVCGFGSPVREWWNDAPTYAEADVVPLTGGQVTSGIDAQLVTGGSITGRVTDESGNPLPGVCVFVPGHPPEDWVSTDTNGRYRVEGLPAGDHYVYFNGCFSPRPLQSEWYDDALRQRDATPVAVTLGSETPVNAELSLDLSPTIAITSGPGATTTAGAAALGFEESEDLHGIECRLDSGAFAPCQSPVTYQGLAPGSHTVTVRGYDWYETLATTSRTWTVDPLAPGETVEGTVPAGGILASDSLGAGPTSANPLTSAVITPNPGFVRITEGGLGAALPGGLEPLASPILIVAPDASSEKPLGIVIRLDASAIPAGTPLGDITVLRDGVAAGECAGAAAADPDPCVRSRTSLPGGDVELGILATRAGRWDIARRAAVPPSDAGTPAGSPAAAPCRVPSVTGMKVGGAKQALVASGCTAGGIKRKRGSGKAGAVVKQSPKAGALLASGSPVRMTVRRRR